MCNVRRFLWQEKHGPRRKPTDILSFKELRATGRFPQKTWQALAKLHGAFNRGEIPWNNPSVLLCKEIMRETKPKKRSKR
jgi:hypothetical protein